MTNHLLYSRTLYKEHLLAGNKTYYSKNQTLGHQFYLKKILVKGWIFNGTHETYPSTFTPILVGCTNLAETAKKYFLH